MKKHYAIKASNETGSPSVLFRKVYVICLVAFVLLLIGSTVSYAQPQFKWAKQISGADDELANFLAIDSAGNVYLTGTFQGTVDVDPGPNTFNLTSEGPNDFYILKLASAGNFLWAKRIGGNTGTALPYVMNVDISGNVYITGNFSGTVDFNPGPDVYDLNSADGGLFVFKFDSSGKFVWAKNIRANSFSVAVDTAENVYLTGSFHGTVDFDPGPGVYNLASEGGDSWPYGDIFIFKLDSSGNFVWAKRIGGMADD
jgi:hypothetical protein